MLVPLVDMLNHAGDYSVSPHGASSAQTTVQPFDNVRCVCAEHGAADAARRGTWTDGGGSACLMFSRLVSWLTCNWLNWMHAGWVMTPCAACCCCCRWDLEPPVADGDSAGEWHMVVKATSPIDPGEELLLSYGA